MSARLVRIAALVVMAAAVTWTYAPAASFAFLNWDDQSVIVQNPAIDLPGAVPWAFSTTYMEHYQPISWLVWAAIKAGFGLDATAFHVANVVVHVVCVLLVWVVARRVLAPVAGTSAPWREAIAVAAALLFGLHPLRVEVVAWVSALPYTIALALALSALVTYLRAAEQAPGRWPLAALALYAASLSARPIALGFPVVLVAVDTWLLRRRRRASLSAVWPFAVLALAAATIESVARAPGLNETPWLYRLQSAASAPFVYLWRTMVPVSLTPLDLLPLAPVATPGVVSAAVLALAVVSLAAWRWHRQYPALAAAWVAYLALVAPAAGLVPSGLQVTADRYAYLPAVVIALVVAGAGAQWAGTHLARARIVVVALFILAVASAATARTALAPWADSVALWTRVVSLDANHEVGLYNLGAALAADGRNLEAAARYRDVLTRNPDHADARANLDRLDAARFEGEANDLATRGDLAGAAERYRLAVTLDPARTHSHAGRGMALATLGRADEAIPELQEAMRQGVSDPAIPNALAVLLLQSGQSSEARAVLETALAAHHDDVGLAHNLARLLATTAGMGQSDVALALRLAGAVVDATGGRDPRALETLAAALAANGRLADAITTNARAAAAAAAQGDADLAVQITARGRVYRNPGQ